MAHPEPDEDDDPDDHPDPHDRRGKAQGVRVGRELHLEERDGETADDRHDRGNHGEHAQDGHHQVLEPVELVAPLAPVVPDDCRVDRDVHPREEQAEHGPNEDIDVQRSAGGIRVVGQDQAARHRDHDRDDRLEVDGVDRRPVLRMDRGEPAR